MALVSNVVASTSENTDNEKILIATRYLKIRFFEFVTTHLLNHL